MPLALDKERVQPTGNIMSQGVLNQLGRPDLDILAVLVREAVQNSWDARAGDGKQVSFGVDGWTLTAKQKAFLKDFIFSDTPSETSLPLSDHLSSDDLAVFVLYDRGTVGLGGPTRADEITSSDDKNHFVDFLRNIGEPIDKQFTGGTYGYGKAAFYRASRSRTICVHTRCRYKNKLESRFMAAALGYPYADDTSKYTGRYWWGHSTDGGVIAPVLNEEADQIARDLGMPPFETDYCGTSIMVIQPYIGERTALQALNLMAENILWYFWPKMLAGNTGRPDMKFSLYWQGQHIRLPAPEEYTPLKGFVEAMYRVKDPDRYSHLAFPFNFQEISSQRPKQTLGRLALQQFQISQESIFDTGNSDDESPFNHITHHTALMRQPELVVKYLPGPPLEDNSVGYSGVFISDREVDGVFADSEPPTHDDWIPNSLDEHNHRIFVNQALKRTYRAMSAFADSEVLTAASSTKLHPIGAFATKLGKLLIAQDSMNGRNILESTSSYNGKSSNSKPLIDDGAVSPVADDLDLQVLDLPDEAFDELIEVPGMKLEGLELQSEIKTLFSSNGEAHFERAVLHYENSGSLILHDDNPALKIDFRVEHADNSIGTIVRANTWVLLDGNQRETEPPAGQQQPHVLTWITPIGKQLSGKTSLFVPRAISTTCSVLISIPQDVMIHVELQTAPKGYDA